MSMTEYELMEQDRDSMGVLAPLNDRGAVGAEKQSNV